MAGSLRRAGDKLRLLRGPEQGRARARAVIPTGSLLGCLFSPLRARHGAYRRGIENDDGAGKAGGFPIPSRWVARGAHEKMHTLVYSREVQITEDRDRRRDRRPTRRFSFFRTAPRRSPERS